MLEFAREVVLFAQARTRSDLDHDRALLRSLERAFVGMRNIIAHEYGRVDLDEIWKTAQRDAPQLVSTLEAIVAKLPYPQ